MARIIKHDIRSAELFDHRPEEAGVGLVADANLDARRLVSRTIRIDVEADDQSVGSEIALPHLERAPAVNADFPENQGTILPWGEMPLIDGEIMRPLMNYLVVIG